MILEFKPLNRVVTTKEITLPDGTVVTVKVYPKAMSAVDLGIQPMREGIRSWKEGKDYGFLPRTQEDL